MKGARTFEAEAIVWFRDSERSRRGGPHGLPHGFERATGVSGNRGSVAPGDCGMDTTEE